ncbi:TonB-dependent receptor [Mesorhizobium sp. DCY119]|uniref:TonB-dependent receptor domain-containing protein n=1 Tax=Mesorhizobium sp. DCY119 TaxID=2108445 RepID=UPI000E6D34E7|nr:TonB-dependent receptor [Mesorhizobium sp. DCY119]RJG46902.1 TonB-dependent receptor [Mesorhizobium sp. DCY119]
MQKSTILAGALALAFTNNAGAQELDDGAADVIKLDTVVVTTPLRRETTLARSTSSVTVIDRREIEQSAAPDLPSLLKSYTGVSIISYGGQGASANVYLRGMSATQTLVLINGVRASSATSGTTSIFNIPLASIERIEVAKGAHSAQYGADAMGGVVNIITKQGGACADGRNACATLTTGVTHPWGGYVSGTVQGRSESGVNYALSGSLLGTRGYDFTTPLAWGHEPDDDGFLQGSANLSLSKEFDWGRLYADGLFARGRSQYDATFPSANEVDTTTFAGKVGAHVLHSDSWSSTVELSSGLDYSTNFRDDVPGGDSQFDTQRYGIFASTEKRFETGKASHILTGGVEAYREQVDSTVDFAVDSRDLAALFSQYSLEYEALRVDTGIRYDHSSQFGSATTYNVGASYEVLPDLVLRSSYATGFRAPTFNDLYYPGYSNPDLKPEKSRSYEVGLNWQATAGTSVDLAFYQTFLADAIASNPPTYLPFNVASARITGFEVTLAHRFSDEWSGKATIDIREPLNQDNGKYIPYRDRFKATAELTYSPTEQLDLTAKVLYGAARYSNAANTVELPDYVTVDFTALYALDAQSQFKFSVENMFDEEYATVTDYRAPGRTFNLSFTRTF